MSTQTEDRRQDEAAPLLAPPSDFRSQSPPPSFGPNVSHIWRAILSVAAVTLILNMGSHISLVPQTAILQDIICREYYAKEGFHPRPQYVPTRGDRCKAEPIQSEVAYINGWRDVSEALPAILLAVPYGALADRAGRKKVLLLSIIGLFMNDLWIRMVYGFPNTLPVRMVWLGGLWQAIGAGAAGLSAISFVLVADICPPEQRTTAFSQINAAQMLSQLAFVPAGGALTDVNAWIPMWISTALTIVGFVIAVLFVPESLPSMTESQAHDHRSLNLSSDEGCGVKSSLHFRLRNYRTESMNLCRWIRRNTRVVLVLSCFFAYYLGWQTNGHLLIQYAAKRLDWPLSKASYIISVGAGVHLLVLALVIPIVSSILLRLQLHELAKDKLIAQISGSFLIIGSGTLFVAASWKLLAAGHLLASLGSAFAVPARSVVTSMVEQERLGSLYTAIAVLVYCGMLIGAPLFASAFRWGMQLGEIWMGLMFLMSGACFLLALLAISASTTGNGDQDTKHIEFGIDETDEDGPASYY